MSTSVVNDGANARALSPRLIEVIEASQGIQSSSQFIAWTQDALQLVLPHEVMIAGVGQIAGARARVHRFLSHNFASGYMDSVVDACGHVRSRVLARWLRERRPQLVEPSDFSSSPWALKLVDNGLANVAAHGFAESGSTLATYFSFSRIPGYLTPTHARTLELLVPYMHIALLRALDVRPVASSEHQKPPANQLTRREQEVLAWIHAGKSNAEIAEILSISRNTVKHVLSPLLRKLRTGDRQDAVTQAIRLGLLPDRRRSRV